MKWHVHSSGFEGACCQCFCFRILFLRFSFHSFLASKTRDGNKHSPFRSQRKNLHVRAIVYLRASHWGTSTRLSIIMQHKRIQTSREFWIVRLGDAPVQHLQGIRVKEIINGWIMNWWKSHSYSSSWACRTHIIFMVMAHVTPVSVYVMDLFS